MRSVKLFPAAALLALAASAAGVPTALHPADYPWGQAQPSDLARPSDIPWGQAQPSGFPWDGQTDDYPWGP